AAAATAGTDPGAVAGAAPTGVDGTAPEVPTAAAATTDSLACSDPDAHSGNNPCPADPALLPAAQTAPLTAAPADVAVATACTDACLHEPAPPVPEEEEEETSLDCSKGAGTEKTSLSLHPTAAEIDTPAPWRWLSPLQSPKCRRALHSPWSRRCARAHGLNSLPCPDHGRQKTSEAEDEETSPEAPCGHRVLSLQLESVAVLLVVPLAEQVLPVGSMVAAPLLPSLRTADLLPASAGAGAETTDAAAAVVLSVATERPAVMGLQAALTAGAEHQSTRARLQPTRPTRTPGDPPAHEPACECVEACSTKQTQ
ncbi:hypothetical protein Taro_053387, partial [Colocasia esculenta]|nr:hypothetical protein [Colocasia esculenta]